MILPVKKIVEEFYWDSSHLDKKWFFVLFHASPVAVNFVNFRVLLCKAIAILDSFCTSRGLYALYIKYFGI